MKKPLFSKMSLFQLMNWFEENNYDRVSYEIIVDSVDDMGYNPFAEMPQGYKGSLEDWERELDEVETYLKNQYREGCEKIWMTITKT